jgi:trehalose/maltose hydrolase-like predicted phosphorylase
VGYDSVKKKHTEKWDSLWNNVDMVIDGDDKAQIGIRFCIYHLLNSAPYHSSDISYPARSLSGQDHRGSIFWDTEIFIAPFFIYSMPDIARNMLIYRYKTLNGARRKAASLGYKGAYYAWESHETGDEKCHSRVFRHADTGRFMINHFRDAQIHVSADIAYCIWQYYETTGDLKFLFKYGAEIVFEIARFFASRVIYDKRKHKYVIKGVLGPDEYHEMVDNNAFTNAMAKESIVIALKTYDLICGNSLKELNRLSKKLKISDDDISRWKAVEKDIFIPQPDKTTHIIEQFSGYYKLEKCSVKEALGRRTKPDEYLGGKFGICSKTQILKQADVIMYLYLMRNRFSGEIKKDNWLFYEPRTEHGSSLSTIN